MPVWRYLVLMAVVEMATGVAALFAAVAVAWWVSLEIKADAAIESFIVIAIVFGVGAPACALFGRKAGAVYRKHMPIRCPKCGGAAHLHAAAPIAFRCASCRHVHKTGIYFNRKRRN